MGRGRPHRLGPRPPPRRRRGQVGPREPALERARRGDDPLRVLVEQVHPDQGRPPGRVRAAQVQRGLHGVRGRGVGGGVRVPRRDARGARAAEPLDETVDGRAREPERRGDLRGGLPLVPEPEHRLTNREGKGARHGRTSRCQSPEIERPRVYQRHGGLKLRVRISVSNWVSRDMRFAPATPETSMH